MTAEFATGQTLWLHVEVTDGRDPLLPPVDPGTVELHVLQNGQEQAEVFTYGEVPTRIPLVRVSTGIYEANLARYLARGFSYYWRFVGDPRDGSSVTYSEMPPRTVAPQAVPF